MCARYTLTAPRPRVEDFLGAAGGDFLQPRFNVAPGQEVAVAVRAPSGARAIVPATFGFPPAASSGRAASARMPNARVETAADVAAFREAFAHRRVLVPADGFYEWRRGRHGAEPYHVALPGGALFAFAGLLGPGGPAPAARPSFAILTGPAPRSLEELHARAPILVAPEHFDAWLDPALGERDRLVPLLRNAPADALHFRAVDPRVNDPRFDEPACLAPAPQLSLL
jgi:putative SOS response-associated peptidase YedK